MEKRDPHQESDAVAKCIFGICQLVLSFRSPILLGLCDTDGETLKLHMNVILVQRNVDSMGYRPFLSLFD